MTEPHLGGDWPGGDPASYFPALWDWLVEDLGVHSVVDVGSGRESIAANYFRQLGCSVEAIDGQPGPQIVEWDYTTGPLYLDVEYDLCWSCEFVEHVEERYVSHFLASFRAAKLLLLTHAVPGQPGHHHVHCKPPDYWLELLKHDGWIFDPQLTLTARKKARENSEERNYFAATGLALWRA